MNGKLLLLRLSFNSTELKAQHGECETCEAKCSCGKRIQSIRAVHDNWARTPAVLALGFGQQQVANDRVLGHARDHQFTWAPVLAAVELYRLLCALIVDPDRTAVRHEEYPSLEPLVANIGTVNLQRDSRRQLTAMVDTSLEVHPLAIDSGVNRGQLLPVTLCSPIEIRKRMLDAIAVLLQKGLLASVLLPGLGDFLFQPDRSSFLRLLTGLDACDASLQALRSAVNLRLDLLLLLCDQFARLFSRRLKIGGDTALKH